VTTYIVKIQKPCSARENPANHVALVVVSAEEGSEAVGLALLAIGDQHATYKSAEIVPAHTAKVVRA
jgi:hypothetical protein